MVHQRTVLATLTIEIIGIPRFQPLLEQAAHITSAQFPDRQLDGSKRGGKIRDAGTGQHNDRGGAHRNQQAQLRRSMRGLQKEGFCCVHVLNGAEEIEAGVFERGRLWTDAR
jgi:hypothetical protein